jgi:Zn-dependent M28 family amino/carboxypeptidase
MSKRIILSFVLIILAILVLSDLRSLTEGITYYVIPAITYNPTPGQPVSRTGRFASLYDLVQLSNLERRDYVVKHLDVASLSVTQIPIPDSQATDVFTRFNSTGPYTIFCAHYDKYHDDTNFQGASDNTSGVSVLLAAAQTLASRGENGNYAFLFTGEEETGLRGASAFVSYARTNHIPIREIVDFDSLGRDALAIRPSAGQPGFFFALPFGVSVAFDGRTFERGREYPLANARLTQSLLRVQPDLVVLQQFTALSDSNVFQANGIDTVAISSSNMYYLQLAWDTYADRVELLDERNLDKAYALVIGLTNRVE